MTPTKEQIQAALDALDKAVKNADMEYEDDVLIDGWLYKNELSTIRAVLEAALNYEHTTQQKED